MHTGEMALAILLLRASVASASDEKSPPTSELYPAAIQLVSTLTDGVTSSRLVTHRASRHIQIEELIGLTVSASAGLGSSTPALAQRARQAVLRHRNALRKVTAMHQAAGAECPRRLFVERIVEVSYRHAAPLVRHTLQTSIGDDPSWVAPRSDSEPRTR